MWFGTRGFEAWVPAPSINPDYSRSGHSSRVDYLTGGVGLRESKYAHNVYSLSWGPTKSRDAVRLITDFADGVFDTQDGTNLIYWIDPMAADKNVLSQGWATPSLACEDGPPLVVDSLGDGRPTAVATAANNFRYPARSAFYTQQTDSIVLEQYIPIPPGYSAWVGVHGDTEDVITVQRVDGYVTVGSAVTPAVMGLTAEQVNTEFSSADSSGIVLSIADVGSETTFTLYALVAQILPIGTLPVAGNFISGQGHSGCEFVGKPTKSPYSARLDRVALSARLEETGMDL